MNTQAQWEKDFWDTRINEGETLAELFSGGDMHNLDFAKEIINPLVQQAILTARKEGYEEGFEKGTLKGERNRVIAQIEEKTKKELLGDLYYGDFLPEFIDEQYPKRKNKDRGTATVAITLFILEYIKSRGISLSALNEEKE